MIGSDGHEAMGAPPLSTPITSSRHRVSIDDKLETIHPVHTTYHKNGR